MRSVLLIGGLDPAGCSGLAADVRAVTALGLHGAPVPTCWTRQTTTVWSGGVALPAQAVGEMVADLVADLTPSAAKTGLMLDAAGVEQVAARLPREVSLVVDPVLSVSSGGWRAPDDLVDALLGRLVPRARLVTPNLEELARLARASAVAPPELATAARALLARGAEAVLVTGGHREPPGADLLVTPAGVREFEAAPIEARADRGTGCALAAAIAAGLAEGRSLEHAVERARRLVRAGLRRARPIGPGGGPLALSRRERIGGVHVLTADPAVAAAAVSGGASVIQFRDKGRLATREACAAVRGLAGLDATIIVDDRADIAAAAGADGVHLGPRDLDPRAARALLGPGALIGVTVHGADGAERALEQYGDVVDYLGAGAVFPTRSKEIPPPVVGLEGLERIVALSPLPVVAIGGIDAGNVAAVARTGAAGVAVLAAVARAADPRAETSRIARAFARAASGAVEASG